MANGWSRLHTQGQRFVYALTCILTARGRILQPRYILACSEVKLQHKAVLRGLRPHAQIQTVELSSC